VNIETAQTDIPDSVRVLLPTLIRTSRLALRRYNSGDIGAFDEASATSLDHIARFMPNAGKELSGDRVAMLAEVIRQFETGDGYEYGIFLPDNTFVGNVGAGRVADGELNIGYWILVNHIRKGYASEAVRAVTKTGFAAGVRRFVLNCHPDNAASIGVARSCGFTYLSTDERDDNGTPFMEMTWELLPGPSARAHESEPQSQP
jgi:RimJ/RimL family protein N-acetyltransferase